jgi:peptidoglycan/LPS O-acetylase OafA/YrhL
MDQAKREFTTLDGMRGIAALSVVTRHAPLDLESVSIFVQSPMAKAPVSVGPFFESYLAVDFFFALSGFVLAHAYGLRVAKGMSAGNFMAIRLIRLYRLYVVALLRAAPRPSKRGAYDQTDQLFRGSF